MLFSTAPPLLVTNTVVVPASDILIYSSTLCESDAYGGGKIEN